MDRADGAVRHTLAAQDAGVQPAHVDIGLIVAHLEDLGLAPGQAHPAAHAVAGVDRHGNALAVVAERGHRSEVGRLLVDLEDLVGLLPGVAAHLVPAEAVQAEDAPTAGRAPVQVLQFLEVLDERQDQRAVAPRQRADREGPAAVRVDLLGQDAGRQGVADGPLEDGQRLFEFIHRRAARNVIVGQPDGADEPRVARDAAAVGRGRVVRVARVPCHAAHGGLDPEVALDGLHGADDARVVGLEGVELEDGEEAGVDGGVDFHASVGRWDQPADEPAVLLAPQVPGHGVADLGGGLVVAFGMVVVAEDLGEVPRRRQPAVHRRTGVRVDAVAFLPQVVGRPGQAGRGVAEVDHEIGRPQDKRVVQRPDVLDVAVLPEVPPQRPQDQGRLVLLDGQPLCPVDHPRVPRRRRRAVRVVLVQQVPLVGQQVGALGVEAAGDVGEAGQVEGVAHQGAVPRPHVRVGVAGELEDVGIVGGDDRPAVIDLRPEDQQAPLVQVLDALRQVAEVVRRAVDPRPPVPDGAAKHALGRAGLDHLVQLAQLVERLGDHQVIIERGRRPALERHGGADGRVDRALADGVAGEAAVLGVAPRALGPAEPAHAGGELVHAVPVPAVALPPAETRQDVPRPPVMDHRLQPWVVVGRVAYLRAVHREVLLEEQADLAARRGRVLDTNLPDVHVAVEVDRVAARQPDAQALVRQPDVGGQRFRQVPQRLGPALVGGPGEPAVGPHAEAAGSPAGVVLLAHVREIQVADLIVGIEGDKQVAVADGNIARHVTPFQPPLGSGGALYARQTPGSMKPDGRIPRLIRPSGGDD